MSLLTEAPTESPNDSTPTKLIYSDCSGCSQLLLVDNAIQNPSLFASSVNDKTFSVTYGWSSTKEDVLALLKSRFTTIDRIAIAFSCQQGSPQPFLDNQVFFTADELFPYSENLAFIISLVKEFKVKQIDYLGCSTLQYALWNQYYSILKRETGITIGASNDQTGNIKYGGNWTLESTGQDIDSVYFTKSIQYYNYVLDSLFTIIYYAGNPAYIYANENIMYGVFTNGDGGTTSGGVYTFNPTTGNTINANYITGGNYRCFVFIDDYIYFVRRTNQGVFKYKKDRSEPVTSVYSGMSGITWIERYGSTLFVFGTSNDAQTCLMTQIGLSGVVLMPTPYVIGYSSCQCTCAGIRDNNLYVAFTAVGGGVIVTGNMFQYDISVPSSPTLVTRNVFTSPNAENANFVIYDKYMYFTKYTQINLIYKINLTDGTSESPVWGLANNPNHYIINLTQIGTKLYASSVSGYMYVYNLTDYSMVCFKEDSLILTDQGYRPVQDLRKGDLVRTLLHGFVPINMIGKRDIHHPASKERIKDQLYECSPANYPEVFEPLVLTGCHSILVDEFVDEKQKQKSIEVNEELYATDDKYRLPACVDQRATVYNKPGSHTIYHFALDNDDYYMNYGVYANGLLVETCSKRYIKELSNMELIE
jgi:hypothetical protein